MLRAFSTAATGMAAQQMTVDVVANNLANVNTTGFKRSQMDFQDLMYVKLAEPGREEAAGTTAPNGLEVGSGVRPASTLKVFTQGEMSNTERSLDIAIAGDGFIEVTLPGGETRYTRDGSLRTNAQGQLVTASGYSISPPVTIPTDTRSINIGKDGTVSVFQAGATTATAAGRITLVRFPNPSGLSSEGSNLFAANDASGTAVPGTAGTGGLGEIMGGFLERSNVQMVTELVNLITAQRAYEINSRAIKAGDEMLSTANRLIQ